MALNLLRGRFALSKYGVISPMCFHIPSRSLRTYSPDPNQQSSRFLFLDNFLRTAYEGNNEWVNKNIGSNVESYEGNNATAHPEVVMLSCCDNRAPISAFGSILMSSGIFSVRNIGNQYSNSCGSTRYALDVLKTKIAIIMGHTNCGAIRAAAANDYNYHHNIVQEIASLVRVMHYTHSLPNIDDFISETSDLSQTQKLAVYSEVNVDFQIKSLLDDTELSRRVSNGYLTVIGLIFDIHDVYDKGAGRLHVTNINGETDKEWLSQHRLFHSFNENEKDQFCTRLYQYHCLQQAI